MGGTALKSGGKRMTHDSHEITPFKMPTLSWKGKPDAAMSTTEDEMRETHRVRNEEICFPVGRIRVRKSTHV